MKVRKFSDLIIVMLNLLLFLSEVVRAKIETIQGQLKEDITLPDLNDMLLHRFFKEATSTLVIFDKKLQQRWEELKILQEEGKALCKG